MKTIKTSLFSKEKLSVICLEGDKEVAETINKALNIKFQNICFPNSNELLTLYNTYYLKYKKYVDLLILDVSNENGLRLFRAIKKINSSQRVILTTAKKKINELYRDISLGIDDLLVKPLSLQNCFSSIQKVLQKIKDDNKDNSNRSFSAKMHQVKQPLNTMSILVSSLKYYVDNNIEITNTDINRFIESYSKQINHLDHTLNDFNMTLDEKSREKFKISDLIISTIELLKADLDLLNINVTYEFHDDYILNASKLDITHLLLNLLVNAKDAFISNKIQKRNIKIFTVNSNNNSLIVIQDNAGGIPEKLISDITNKSNFTTKANKEGSGLGLGIVYEIMKKYMGSLDVQLLYSTDEIRTGTRFILKFPLNND